MSKEIVDCIHWDPEVDAPAKRNIGRSLLILGAIVAAVAVVVCLWLFLPRPEPPPVEPPTETGQAIHTTAPPAYSVTTTAPSPLAPGDDLYLAQGKAMYESGNYMQALLYLNQAIAANPRSGAAYTYRGLTNFSLGDRNQEVVSDVTQAIRYLGDSADLRTLRGTASFLLGQYPEAIGDLTQAIELNPDGRQAYEYRARAYEATGRMDLAQADRAKLGIPTQQPTQPPMEQPMNTGGTP
ncbi:MAG: tetratricopeptide repeat protein [Oscillospiraceae bacterium]|nr:tetratricopeptide repeat protein [Oscillospiraceae bacterium]